MLALSANLERELKKATVEPVIYVEVALSSTRTFCTDFALNDTDADPVVDTMTITSQSYDPINRNIQLSEVDIRLVDDGTLRGLLSSEVLISKDVTVSLGTTGVVKSDQEVIFRGPILSVFFEHGSITLRVGSLAHPLKDYICLRTFFSKHPFEVLTQLLDDCGVDSSKRDTTSFTPSTYANEFSHYVYSSINNSKRVSDNQQETAEMVMTPALTAHGVAREGYNGRAWHATWMVNARGFAEETMMVTRCIMFVDGNGKLKIKHFNSSDSAVRHFTEDDYRDFEQVPGSGAIYNTVKIGCGPSSKSDYFILRDETSIGVYGQKDWEGEIVYNTACADWINGDDHVSISDEGIVEGAGVDGFAGTRDILGAQTSDKKISSNQPWYAMWRKEIFKATTAHSDRGKANTLSRDEFGELGSGVWTPAKINVNGLATRPFGGTQSDDEPDAGGIFDITAAYQFAHYLLTRFSNGAPQIRLSVGLENIDLELGDFVTLDNDMFASAELSLNGLDSDVKWEITGKEVNPLGSDIGVVLELTYATKTSPPSTNIGIKVPAMMDMSGRSGFGVSANARTFGDTSINRGLEPTAGAGLTLNIGAGSAARGGMATLRTDAQDLTMTANKDSYISIDPDSGSIVVDEVSTGADEPFLAPGHARIAKVVAGSSITSVGDYRILGSVGPEQVNRTAMQPSENKIWNGAFEYWPRQLEMAPNWHIDTGTYGTHFNRDVSTVYRGTYSMKMENVSGVAPQMFSDYFSIDPNAPLEISVWAQSLGALPVNKFGVYFYQKDKTAASTTYTDVHGSALAATGTWYHLQGIVEVPSNAVYGRLRMSCTTSPLGKLYYDNAYARKAEPTFKATGAATTSLTVKQQNKVECSTEVHDYGGNYDHSSNYRFTAPEGGMYCFEASAHMSYTGGSTYTFATIKKNGTPTTGTELARSYAWPTDTSTTHDMMMHLQTGAVALDEGDYVEFYVHPEVNTSATLDTTPSLTWFAGRKLR